MAVISSVARTAAVFGGLGAAALAYGWGVERHAYALRQVAVPVLPSGSGPIRILQVADIHLVPGQRDKVAWLRSLVHLDPDFVINTGDNLSHRDAVPELLTALEPLLERPGLFVLGSNDVYGPSWRNPARYLTAGYKRQLTNRPRVPTDQLVAGLSGGGWLDLNNARTMTTVADSAIEFVGVNDPHIDRDDYASVAGRATPNAALTIGVMHAPYQRVLNAMAADGAQLIVAGHTHGGQIAIPGFGALTTNSDLDRGRAKGLSRWWDGAGAQATRSGLDRILPGAGVASPSSAAPADAAWLHVSAGVGTSSTAPVRIACRPEASLLTLVARDTATPSDAATD